MRPQKLLCKLGREDKVDILIVLRGVGRKAQLVQIVGANEPSITAFAKVFLAVDGMVSVFIRI